jgi:hypothetical protein
MLMAQSHPLVIPPPTSKKNTTNKTVSDEAVEKLNTLFSEQLLLAALDLIDRDCGMRKLRHFLSFPLFYHIKKASLTSRVIFQ